MGINKQSFVGIVVLVSVFGLASSRQAAAATSPGITVTPATFRLELKHGQIQNQTSFTLTNGYTSSIALHFSFKTSPNNVSSDSNADPAGQLSIATPDITIQPHDSITQTVTLSDSRLLAPGSQLVDLVVSEVSPGTRAISTVPSIRLPVVIIKDDGAFTRLTATTLPIGGIRTGLPRALSVTIRNTGNVVTAPHGAAIITDGAGNEVSKGVLNSNSQALAPGASVAYTIPLTQLAPSRLLGKYQVSLSYGLGGGLGVQLVRAHFFYIGWQHITGAVLVFILLYAGIRTLLYIRSQPNAAHRGKKSISAARAQ